MFDEEPEDPHGECAHEIARLSRMLSAANARLGKTERDAARWRKLTELVGHWQEGSNGIVRLFQDDATRECFIEVDGKADYGPSFESVIDRAAP